MQGLNPFRRTVVACCLFGALAACTGSGASYDPQASEQRGSHLLRLPATKPSAGGELKIVRADGKAFLADQQGKSVQLRGMSTTGLQWFPQILNDRAFKALSRDWGANVIRLALYVGEGGYASNPSLKQKVIEGIELAIANDMYVIVDWHVLTPGDPHAPVYAGALDFFRFVASRFPNNRHIIYELVNEPNPGSQPGNSNDAAGWASIKAYASPIVAMLRAAGHRNLILIGTPNWSQRPDLAADNPITDDNLAYTFHFYTGTHAVANDAANRANVMSNVRYALKAGVPLFAPEWGTSKADGNGGPFLQAADDWLEFLNANNISWVNWSLATKNESSAAFGGKPAASSADPGPDEKWSADELSPSGQYVRTRIKGVSAQHMGR